LTIGQQIAILESS